MVEQQRIVLINPAAEKLLIGLRMFSIGSGAQCANISGKS